MAIPYINEKLPLVSYGTSGGLSYSSTVVANPARKEVRFQLQNRGYWNLSLNLSERSKLQMSVIQRHYSLMQGKVCAWPFKNNREYFTSPNDYTGPNALPESLRIEDGQTVIQMIHTRHPGTVTEEVVPIIKPDPITGVILFINGDWDGENSIPNEDYSVDYDTGIITLNDPLPNGTLLEGVYFWFTPVRYDFDDSEISWDDYDVFNNNGVRIREVRL